MAHAVSPRGSNSDWEYQRDSPTPRIHYYGHGTRTPQGALTSADPCVAARHVNGRLLDLSRINWRTCVADQSSDHSQWWPVVARACDNFLYVFFKGASSAPAPSLRPAQRRRAQAGRERKRELRRAAPPGRWWRRKSGDCLRPARRLRPRPLACGRCRARRPTRGGHPATARPLVAHRHVAPGTAPSASRAAPSLASHDALEPGVSRQALLPSTRRGIVRGRPEPVKGAPSPRPSGQTLDRTTAASPRDPWRLSG